MLPNAQAEEAKLTKETSYEINAFEGTTKTIIRDDTSKQSLIESYLFTKVAKALEKTSQVKSVVFVPGAEKSEDYSWASYTSKVRESYAYVNIDLNTQVSLLFKVKEELRKCKTEVKSETTTSSEVADDDFEDWGTDSSACDIHSLKSEVVVEGPIAVYGTFASSVDVNNLLKDRQKLKISIETNFSKELQMQSTFEILSSSFEENLLKMFEAFQFKPMIGDNFTRRKLLVGIARAMRNINERVLEL